MLSTYNLAENEPFFDLGSADTTCDRKLENLENFNNFPNRNTKIIV